MLWQYSRSIFSAVLLTSLLSPRQAEIRSLGVGLIPGHRQTGRSSPFEGKLRVRREGVQESIAQDLRHLPFQTLQLPLEHLLCCLGLTCPAGIESTISQRIAIMTQWRLDVLADKSAEQLILQRYDSGESALKRQAACTWQGTGRRR